MFPTTMAEQPFSATQHAKSALRHQDIVSSVQLGRVGLRNGDTILAQSNPFTVPRVGSGRGTPTRAGTEAHKGSVAGEAGPMDTVVRG